MPESSQRPELDPGERLLDKGRNLLEIERYDLAEAELARAVAARPEDADAHFHLARALHGLERTDDCLGSMERAISLAPTWAAPHALRAHVLAGQGRNSEAERSVLEALRLDPELGFAYEVYAELMHATGHLAKAEALYRKALELDPESASGHSGLSRVLSEANRAREAEHAGARGLELEPVGVDSHASMAYRDLRAGRPFRARAHLREALRTEPSTELEEAYLEADGCCRVVYLPMYYYSLLVERIPGRQFTIWILFVAFVFNAQRLGIPPEVSTPVAISYGLFCIYTWLSRPLLGAWRKVFPAR